MLFGSLGLSTIEPYTIMFYPLSSSVSLSCVGIGISPWHRLKDRNFIFNVYVHIYPPYMNIKYLVILTGNFLNGNHFVIFPHTDSCRDIILHVLTYLFFTFIHKRNNATVTYFLKFMTIFLKFICSLLLTHVL